MKNLILRKAIQFLAIGSLAALASQARAGSVTYNFDTDPTAVLEIIGNGINTTPWQPTGGNPASGGFLALTYAVDSMQCGMMFPDLDTGKVVTAFTFSCDLRVGNSEGDRGADGFAISFARGSDPFVANPNMGVLAATLPEAGTVTGIAIGFDTWSGNTLPDGGDIEGIIVRVDNKSVLKQAMPTRHGACDDATSLQTGPRDPDFWAAGGDIYSLDAVKTLCWAPLSVALDENAKLTVKWKGKTLLDKYQTKYFPTPGRLVLTGRTGGENEATHFDNIVLNTTAIVLDTVAPTMPTNLKAAEVGAGRVLLTWDAATDNSGKVGYEVERDGTVISGVLTETKFEDWSVTTKTTYAYKVRAVDTSSNTSAFTTAVSATTIDFMDSMGFLIAQVYDGNTATDVGSLTSDAKYPDSPDRTVFVTGLDTPNGFADNYGLRLAGVLVAPETASYHFFIQSDDASQFFLNTKGEAIPDALAEMPIIEETGCCAAFEEPEASTGATTYDPIPLTAGKKYGFLLLLKEGTGGDYAQVAWRKVGDTAAAATLKPISGVFVLGKCDPVGSRVSIAQAPQNTTVSVGKTATFGVTVDAYSPYTTTVLYQWYRDGKLIPGAQESAYTIPATAQADNGAKFKVLVAVPGTNVTSAEATLTLTSDSVPPTVASAGAIASSSGSTFDVGVTFDEPVDETSAGNKANYTLSAGTISGIKFYKGSPGVVLTVSGLAAGSTGTVTVKDVADKYGNKMASASKDFKVSAMKWGVVGGNELGLGNGVIATAENGFDIYSDGIGEWGTYDETTFVFEEVTGNFDKVLRVEYQDSSSQWARAGLIVRDVTNFGVDRATQEGGACGRYQKVHVNPVFTAMGTAGNNLWEGNRRLATGDATTTAGGSSSPNTPKYPNAWCRLQRTNDLFIIYRSDDGLEWTQLGTTTFTDPMPAKLYVGPEFSPENGNIGEDTGLRGVWVAKFRDYGNYPVAVAGKPEIGISKSGAAVAIAFKGKLQSADNVKGPFQEVAGAASPYTVPAGTVIKFYRAAGQ